MNASVQFTDNPRTLIPKYIQGNRYKWYVVGMLWPVFLIMLTGREVARRP